MIFTMQLFRLFRFCSACRVLRGALPLLCLAVLACGHRDNRSAPMSHNSAPQARREEDPVAAGLDKFFLHDKCTGEYPPQPDTCLHDRQHEQSFTLGGKAGEVYDVTLHVRGIFEPTTIIGGDAPDPAHPYFKVGGAVNTPDWSRWAIEVSQPKQTYWLNHYPSVAHKIYKEDFEATTVVAAGATVVIRVTDGNDRQIDNGKIGPDRQQIIAGVTDRPLSGQMLRLDVVRVKRR